MATIREQALEYLKQLGYANPDEGEIQGAIREVQSGTGGNPVVIPEMQKYVNEIQVVQTQIANLTAQADALKKYGLTDTNQLTQDAGGNWIPLKTPTSPNDVDESKAFENAQKALEPDRTAELADLEKGVETEKQRLQEDWNTYLSDINTGKLRAGTDQEQTLKRQLEQKTEYIQQQEMNIKQNMNTLNRSWMAKGGLFSGARLQAGQEYQTQEQMAKQRYESQLGYTQQQQGEAYNRTLADYQTAQNKGQTAYNRGVYDVGQEKIKNIRSLNEYYNKELAAYAGSTNYASARKFNWGY